MCSLDIAPSTNESNAFIHPLAESTSLAMLCLMRRSYHSLHQLNYMTVIQLKGELSTFSNWATSSLPTELTNALPISSFALPIISHIDHHQDSIETPYVQPLTTEIELNQQSLVPPFTNTTSSFLPPPIEQSNLQLELYVPVPNGYSVVTCSKQGIQCPNPKYLGLNTVRVSPVIPTEPRSITSTMKHPRWSIAMDEELPALHTNHTRTLVTPSPQYESH